MNPWIMPRIKNAALERVLFLWRGAVYPAICLVNTHLNIHSGGGGEQTEKIDHSLWWASDPREVPDPSTKNLFIYHCDTIRHGHPSEKMAGTPSLFPLLLSCLLFFRKSYALGFSFFILGVRTSHLLMDTGGQRTKRPKESKQKSNKGLIGHAGRSQRGAGQFTYAPLWWTWWNTQAEWNPAQNRTLAQFFTHSPKPHTPRVQVSDCLLCDAELQAVPLTVTFIEE